MTTLPRIQAASINHPRRHCKPVPTPLCLTASLQASRDDGFSSILTAPIIIVIVAFDGVARESPRRYSRGGDGPASDRVAAGTGCALERYCTLLWDWNTKINLTRHTDYEKFVARDLVDSLAFARFLAAKEKVLDVGTGGGVPGVVLAIVRGDLPISLSESVGKKARVLADIVARLGLQTPVLHARAEDVLGQQRFDTLWFARWRG